MRRAWLVERIKFLGGDYPDAVERLARLWPQGVPTLKTNGHMTADLDAIYAVIVHCEAQFCVPFSTDPYPTSNPKRKKFSK